MSLFECDQDQGLKGAIHGSTAILAAEMSVYRLARYRRTRHLGHLWCGLFYAGLLAFECVQIAAHIPRRPA